MLIIFMHLLYSYSVIDRFWKIKIGTESIVLYYYYLIFTKLKNIFQMLIILTKQSVEKLRQHVNELSSLLIWFHWWYTYITYRI